MKDQLITVIGGSGFIGRYVVRELLKAGARVRIAARDPRDGWFLKTQGGLGQTQFVAVDVTRPETLSHAIAGTDAVVSLVGILSGDFETMHVDGARNVAAAAAAAGCGALVHVSAIGADPASPSRYGRSKGDGEAAVRAAFPAVTILRPSIVFGREDKFVNRFAGLIELLPVVPVVRGATKLQPVYVGDVARAVAAAIADPGLHAGKIYELGGPEIFTLEGLNHWIAAATGRHPTFVAIPDVVSGAMARGLGWLPGAPITNDQWLMLGRDNVVSGADGLSTLGIAKTPIEAVAEDWLVRYRRQGRFALQKD